MARHNRKTARQETPQIPLFGATLGLPLTQRWRDGARIGYLGAGLQLKLNTGCRQAQREEDGLHLPLPPDASGRQIQDAAESWLRHEAEALFSRVIETAAKRLGCAQPGLALSFAVGGSWTQIEPRRIRVNWRLIEQPLAVVDLTLRQAVARLPTPQTTADLFAALT